MTRLDITTPYDLEEYLMHTLAAFLETAEGDEDFLHEYIQLAIRRAEDAEE